MNNSINNIIKYFIMVMLYIYYFQVMYIDVRYIFYSVYIYGCFLLYISVYDQVEWVYIYRLEILN